MNFYIGNSIGKIDKQDVNVEFSDKLINFIYKLREKEKYIVLLKIPHVELGYSVLSQIIFKNKQNIPWNEVE